MKNKLFIGLAIITATILLFPSCQPDNKDTKPAADSRDAFIGSWLTKESCVGTTTPSTFTITVSKVSSNSTEVNFSNFNQLGSGFAAHGVISSTNVSFSSQVVSGNTISGSGTINAAGTEMNLSYTVNDGAQTDNYTAKLTK